MTVGIDREFVLLQCRQCSLVYATPRPTEAELRDFYGASYFKAAEAGSVVRYDDYRSCAEYHARAMWAALRTFAPDVAFGGGVLLDVGCATGAFLDEARKDDWRCVGVEYAADAAAVAREEFALEVILGDLFSQQLDNRSFDLVTMWHVLEHLVEPRLAIERVRSLLAPGGHLFVELPNWRSVGRLARRERWSQLTPPEHINFFTPQALLSLSAEAGLEVLKLGTDHHRFVGEHGAKRVLLALAAAGVSAAGLGGHLRLLARRPIGGN